MADLSDVGRVLLYIGVVVSSMTVLIADEPRCMSCTYNRAGDGTTDFECVTSPYNHTSHILTPCNFTTHGCYTKADYSDNDFTTIRSLARGCYVSNFFPATNSCNSETQPTCYFYCQSDRCNDGTGDLHRRYTQGGSSSRGESGHAFCYIALLLLGGWAAWLNAFQ